MINFNSTETFKNLFKGREDAYLEYNPEKYPSGYTTIHEELTLERYRDHLEGRFSLGVFPINKDEECCIGIIDDDFHHKNKGYDYNKLLQKINLLELPVSVYKSKTGGAHIVLHFDKWYPIKDVRHILKKFAYQLCEGDYEIFPKQDEVGNGLGNAINLPYHNGNTRVLIDSEGKPYGFDDAMLCASEKAVSLNKLTPFKLLADKKMVVGRNCRLLRAKQFFKKFYSKDWEERVWKMNALYYEPLEDKEVKNTVLKSKDLFNNEEEDVSAWRKGIRASEIRATYYEPLPAVVDGLIFPGITFITGKSKLGKSYMALQLGNAVETGGKFLNCQCVKGDVLHYSLEDGRRRNQSRWKQMGIKPENALYQFRDRKPKPPLLTLGLEKEIEDWIKNTPNPKLVIIDPYVKVKKTLGGKNMNAYENDNYNLQDIYTLANKYNIAIVFLHHTKKKSENDVFDEMNGSSGIQSNCDSMIVLSSQRKMGQNVTFSCLPKDAEQKEFEIALNSNCVWEYVGKCGQAGQTKIKKAIIEAVKKLEAGNSGASTADIKDYVAALDNNWKRDHVGTELTRLAENGDIVKIRKGVYKSANY